jgi:hypothetical protein
VSLFIHVPHPHIAARKAAAPVTVAAQAGGGLNARIALRLTAMVGTMPAAYLFTVLALFALPAVLGFSLLPARTLLIVAWISQTFIQLVMLAVLQLGQNIAGTAADKRAEATYLDAESILHECLELQRHLQAQDASGSDVRSLIELNNALTEAIHQKVKAPAPVTASTT